MDCSKSTSIWECGAWHFRAFRAWPYADHPGIWVAIDPKAKLGDVKRRALQALASLAGPGRMAECESAADQLKAHDELRTLLAGGDGLLLFYEDTSTSNWSMASLA